MAATSSQVNISPNPILYSPLDHTQRQVRFIEILPSDDDDQQVCCRLETASLLDNLPYAALSYVWGNPKITEDISVNGIVLPVTVNLASALRQLRKTGLLQDQQADKLQRLWVDAICINQKDTGEKGSQVALMGELYGSASSVLSWLGQPGPYRIDKALLIIRHVAFMTGAAPNSDNSIHDKDAYDAFTWLIRTLGLISSIINPNTFSASTPSSGIPIQGLTWASLTALERNIYWERIWIVQEMVLSKSLWAHWFICGDEFVTFAELERYRLFIAHLTSRPFPSEYKLTPIESASWNTLRLETAYHGLQVLRMVKNLRVSLRMPTEMVPESLFSTACVGAIYFSASDPRDMVYGILGMVPGSEIKPDYGRTVKEVFIKAVGNGGDKHLNVCLGLSGRGYGIDNTHNLPSWLPDLTRLKQDQERGRYLIETRSDNAKPAPGLFGESEPKIIDEDIFCVQGVVCDHVDLVKRLDFDETQGITEKFKWLYMLCVDYLTDLYGISKAVRLVRQSQLPDTTPEVNREKRPLEILAELLDWWYKDAREKTTSFLGYSGVNFSNISWELLLLLLQDRYFLTEAERENVIERFGMPHDLNLDNFMAFCLTDYFKVQKEKAEGDLPNLSQIDYTSSKLNIFNMLNRIAGRSLFKTDKGYFGIGPPYMKQGDLVCAVDNCTIPVLLRKSGDVADDASFLEHVGNCYVSGLSDGEAADMVAKDGLEVQTFRIR